MHNTQINIGVPIYIIVIYYNRYIDKTKLKWYYIRLYKERSDYMAYHAESQKRYNDKCNIVKLKYTEKEKEDYTRLIKHIENNNLKISTYIKELIKNDLDIKDNK